MHSASLEDLLGNHRVLSLHKHALPRQCIKGASFRCVQCGQLRYEVMYACARCKDVAVCEPCFRAASAEQDQCYADAQKLEAKAIEAQREKANQWRRSSTDTAQGSTAAAGSQLPPLLSACVRGDHLAAKDIVDKSDFMHDVDLEETVHQGPHQGRTPLILAAMFGHKPIVELLLSHDTQIEAIDNAGMTSLMHAAYSGHTEVVDELLFNHATIDRVAFCGYTPLLFAANRGHSEVIRRLLTAGASPIARTPKGRSALIVASFNGHIDTVRILLSIPGLELDARDDEGYTAQDAAQANHHVRIVDAIEEALCRPGVRPV